MTVHASRSLRASILLAALLCAGGCASFSRSSALARSIDSLAAAPPFDRAIWGIAVEDEAGCVLYDRNAHRLMIPASNRKLFSAATDAVCLGLDTRLSTELWLDGEDVVIRGDGDPSFGAARRESPGFVPLVAALRDRGITSVRDVVADVSRFDRATIPGSWKAGNLGQDYAAPVDAIAFGENVSAGRAVADPALHAAGAFRNALILAGIHVTGVSRALTSGGPCAAAAQASGACVRVAAVQSPAVAELLTAVLKNSQNLYAEMLFKRSSADGSYEEAAERERAFLMNEAGVPAGEMRFLDGSGLSPDDLVTPSSIVRVLRWMNAPARRGIWWMILAQPGGEGTLRLRMALLGSRLRGKTGTIAGVNALSGIVAGRSGGFRYFSVIINHHLAESSEAVKAIDAIVETIADF